MFTGLVEEMGTVSRVDRGEQSARLAITGEKTLQNLALGGSIAVNGVCLTAIEVGAHHFLADVSWETLKVTSLSDLKPGNRVNLERPVTFGASMGGHFVQGHVDGVGVLAARTPGDAWEQATFAIPKPLMAYVVPKGSIALDGISLTVAEIDDAGSTISVALIPETLRATTLGSARTAASIVLFVT